MYRKVRFPDRFGQFWAGPFGQVGGMGRQPLNFDSKRFVLVVTFSADFFVAQFYVFFLRLFAQCVAMRLCFLFPFLIVPLVCGPFGPHREIQTGS